MRIRAVLSAALLTWAATACTSGGGAAAKPSASPPGQVIGTTTTKPLTFGAEPLWTDQTTGVPHSAGRFALHDDSVVMFNGPKGSEAYRLSVQDAATGKTRWSVRMWRPILLDAATGRTRWSRPTGAPGRVAAIAGDLLLLREQQGGTLAAPVILDLAKGTELGRMPARIGNCVEDRATLIACEALSPEPRLFTIGAGDRKVRVSAHTPPRGMVITLQVYRVG